MYTLPKNLMKLVLQNLNFICVAIRLFHSSTISSYFTIITLVIYILIFFLITIYRHKKALVVWRRLKKSQADTIFLFCLFSLAHSHSPASHLTHTRSLSLSQSITPNFLNEFKYHLKGLINTHLYSRC